MMINEQVIKPRPNGKSYPRPSRTLLQVYIGFNHDEGAEKQYVAFKIDSTPTILPLNSGVLNKN